jgi:diguanylate cyclase (GGDEF)-like protein
MPEPNVPISQDLAHVLPYDNAEQALDSILDCLYGAIPFKVWMVTRLDDDDWIIVRALDHGYGIKPGSIFSWKSTFCVRMSNQQGPMFAEDTSLHEAYRGAEINQGLSLPIGAYIGLPLFSQKGRLDGTLCALDPAAQHPLTPQQRLLATTLARILSTLLMVYSEAEAAQRRAELHRYEAETDALTGLYNRRGWQLALQDQESATLRTVQNAMVIVIDLDDLKVVNDTLGHHSGDELLRRTAQVLRTEFRDQDVIARTGGDEFAVLVPGASSRAAQQRVERLRAELQRARIRASVGYALRLANASMHDTVMQADRAMYRDKRQRHDPSPSI